MKYADLHVHTFYSDSTSSPEEVISCAKDRGLAAIAICDHDSIEGIEPSLKFGRAMNVEVIPSVELTVEKEDAEIHLLGYFIDWKDASLCSKLKEMQKMRIERVREMIRKLHDAGVKVESEEVFRLAGRGTVGRLHLAQAIIKAGTVKSFREVFEKYIGFRKPCYISSARFSPRETIEMVLKAGGVPVLAHPAIMGKDEYIPELIEYGLKGIEVYHTDHKNNAVRHYEELAKKYNLLMTGGSDCHGLGKGRVMLGEIRVSYDLVELLKKASKNGA